MSLLVIETHPIQYHAPIYRVLQQRFAIPVTAVYGSDFSVAGYRDQEFGASFAWDSDLLSGYSALFLQRVAEGGAADVAQLSSRGLAAALQRVQPAAILLTGYSPAFYRSAIWQAWRSGKALLFRAETSDVARGRSAAIHRLRDGLLRRLYRRCSALLYVGQHSCAHYRRLGCPEHKLVFSPYCVDARSFQCDEDARRAWRNATRQELCLTKQQMALLVAGKLVPRKGPDLLIQAVRRLPPALRERMVILFLGDGELRETLGSMAAGDPLVATRFIGFQNQSRLSRYYHAADLLVLASRHDETWGLVVNEALHHGVPGLLSNRVGCAPDLIDPGLSGEVFQSDSVASLATMLTQTLNLVGRPDIRAHCRRKVAAYSVEQAAAGIATAYQRALAAVPTA
jgi:glycosyltransferase involved in cell wall biosynthesis